MGAWGGIVMSFFGAVFAALTAGREWHASGPGLVLPFLGFAAIGLIAAHVIRLPGAGPVPSPKARRTILWSSTAEGIGVFLAANIVANLQRPDLLLPAMALVVGLHFLPIALATGSRPFLVLGAVLILSAVLGLVEGGPAGGTIAGATAAAALWIAAILAVRREWRAKRGAMA